jgi:capsular polysaccharide biosynthesis protein
MVASESVVESHSDANPPTAEPTDEKAGMSSTRAATGRTPKLSRRRAVIARRGWVVIVTTVLAGVSAVGVGSLSKATYKATAVVYVNPGASASGPGLPAEAAALATTYAGLIPADSSIVDFIAGTLHQPVSVVRKSITVLTKSTTGILDLTYEAPSAAAALAGSRALALSIAGSSPVSSTVPAKSVTLASLPTQANESGQAAGLLAGIGVVVGLLLGVVLVVTWERLDRRIDLVADLNQALQAPASDELQLHGPAATALVGRWSQTGEHHPVIGLVATRPGDLRDVRALAAILGHEADASYHGGGSGPRPRAADGITPLPAPPFSDRIVPFGSPASNQVGQLAALQAATVVLVAVEGTRTADVLRARQVLEEFGHGPDWGVLLPRRTRRRAALLQARSERTDHPVGSTTERGLPAGRPSRAGGGSPP